MKTPCAAYWRRGRRACAKIQTLGQCENFARILTGLVGQTVAAHYWLYTQHQYHLHVIVLMQALTFTEFEWLWISTEILSVCRVTVMQLNANGLGCKSQGTNCSHVLDSGEHVLGLRLSATPSDHAFRPRFTATPFSHVFQPRLPAMSSDVLSDRRRYVSRHSNFSSQ